MKPPAGLPPSAVSALHPENPTLPGDPRRRRSVRLLRTALIAGLFEALALVSAPVAARPAAREPVWCEAGGVAEAAIAASRTLFFERQRGFVARSASPPRVTRVGEIAVIEDDGTLVNGNPFDLAETSLRFAPRGGGYSARKVAAVAIPGPAGRRLDLQDDDATFVAFPGFQFRFYGKSYDGVWVNSDGNLTFGAPASILQARDLVEFMIGPPRIAALFTDLDPARAEGQGGVWLELDPGRWLRVIWYQLPLRQSLGTATVGLVLHRDGSFEVDLGEVGPATGVVGVSPGRTNAIKLVDLSRRRASARSNTALAEEFAGLQIDIAAIGRAFHSQFSDHYTSLVTWFDFPVFFGFLASHRLVANDTRGIGIDPVDFSAAYGSRRLQSFITMGSIDRYPADPDETFNGTFSTLDVLGHEVGHRWLSFVRYKDGSRQGSRRLLGRQLGHWSFYFNSDASIMEGNEIRDLGGGRFRTVDASQGYGPLDLYLMGLAAPEEVPPLFWVEGNQGKAGPRPSSAPEIGVRFTGKRHDLELSDIVAQEGARSPSHVTAPKTFHTAFAIVVPKGRQVRQGSIAKLERLRARWEEYFAAATGGRGEVNSQLKGRE